MWKYNPKMIKIGLNDRFFSQLKVRNRIFSLVHNDNQNFNQENSYSTWGNRQTSNKFTIVNNSLAKNHCLLNLKNYQLENIRHASTELATSPKWLSGINGIWKSLSESSAVLHVQDYWIWFHNTTGLPWWSTIIVATILVKTLTTFPLAVYQHYNASKVELMRYEWMDNITHFKRDGYILKKENNWSDAQVQRWYRKAIKDEWDRLVLRDNCHPLKGSILVIVQLPLWIIMSFSMRNMCLMLPDFSESAFVIYQQLTEGGIGWLSNLTLCDPYYILPVIFGFTNLCIVEMNYMLRSPESNTKIYRVVTNIFRFASCSITVIAMYMPSGVLLYWTTSTLHSLVQNLIFLSPKFRRFVGIPITPEEKDNPYRHIYHRTKSRIGLLKERESI